MAADLLDGTERKDKNQKSDLYTSREQDSVRDYEYDRDMQMKGNNDMNTQISLRSKWLLESALVWRKKVRG